MFNFLYFRRRKLQKKIRTFEAQHKYLSRVIANAEKQQRQIDRYLRVMENELVTMDGINPNSEIEHFERNFQG